MSRAAVINPTSLPRRLLHPGRLLAIGVFVLTAGGTLLLDMPIARRADAPPMALEDVIFTATAAATGTGFAVVDPGAQLSGLGCLIVALQMEVGLVLMMVLGSLLAVAAGSAAADRQSLSVRRWLGDTPRDALVRLPRIFAFVLALVGTLQLIGAIVIWLFDPAGTSFGQAVFTSVSALSNTGWSLGGDRSGFGLIEGHFALLPLVIIGSLGLPVLMNLYDAARYRIRRRRDNKAGADTLPGARRLSLQTRLVLVTMLAVYIVGTLAIWIAQHEHKLATASFLSAARTTGFDSASVRDLSVGGRFALVPLMMIGGSSGSSCGGIKSLSIAVLFLAAVATLRQNRPLEAFGRTLPDVLVRIAMALLVMSVGATCITALALLWLEPCTLGEALFEAASAVGNSGLSVGLVERLGPAGKMVIIAAMLVGRIGPLWLLTAVAHRRDLRGRYSYPEEPVGLG